MSIEVSIPFKASIAVESDKVVQVVGERSLLLKIKQLKEHYGVSVGDWPLTCPALTADDMLVNELIEKIKGQASVFLHDEICHCRAVKTSVVRNAIMDGCAEVSEVSRTTLAGTGCGTCRMDIAAVIKQMKKLE